MSVSAAAMGGVGGGGVRVPRAGGGPDAPSGPGGGGLAGRLLRWRLGRCRGGWASCPWDYLLAAAAAAAGFYARSLVVGPGDGRFPLFLALPVALLCAAALGRGPAVLAAVVSIGLPAWFLAPPIGSFLVADGAAAAVMAMNFLIAVGGAWAVDRGVGLFAERETLHRELLARVDEREALHRELLHRTKNDLMVVVSLINLRASDCLDASAREVLLGAAAIVRNAHHVHDAATAGLGHHDDPVDTGGFLAALAAKLRLVLVEAERHALPHATVKSLGYLLVELAAGAQTAAGGGAAGAVSVRFLREGDEFVLEVEEPASCAGRVSGAGRLAQGLARSLGGRLSRRDGTGEGRGVFELRFPAGKGQGA